MTQQGGGRNRRPVLPAHVRVGYGCLRGKGQRQDFANGKRCANSFSRLYSVPLRLRCVCSSSGVLQQPCVAGASKRRNHTQAFELRLTPS